MSDDGKGMINKLACYRMGDDEELTKAIIFLILHAIKGGVVREGESCTILMPSVEAGPNKDKLMPLGTWEIKLKKVNGDVGDDA